MLMIITREFCVPFPAAFPSPGPMQQRPHRPSVLSVRRAVCTALALVVVGLASTMAAATPTQATHLVWPPPQHISTSGPALPLHPAFAITTASQSVRLASAIARHQASTFAPAVVAAIAAAGQGQAPAEASTGQPQLRLLTLDVHTADEFLGIRTRYDYNLTVTAAGVARASCTTIYGCQYALETLAQLVDIAAGSVRHDTVLVVDEPDYAWRGIMLDTGRRFFPMDTVRDILTVRWSSACCQPFVSLLRAFCLAADPSRRGNATTMAFVVVRNSVVGQVVTRRLQRSDCLLSRPFSSTPPSNRTILHHGNLTQATPPHLAHGR